MRKVSKSIAVAALVLAGIGAAWVISRGNDGGPLVDTEDQTLVTPGVVHVNPLDRQAEVTDVSPSTNLTDETPGTTVSSAPVDRPERRAFEERGDSNPALSLELETAVRNSLDTTLDRSKLDLESLICRGESCQVILAPQPQTPWSGGMSAVSALLRDLHERPARDPGTGADLKPSVQQVSSSQGESPGVIAIIGFERP